MKVSKGGLVLNGIEYRDESVRLAADPYVKPNDTKFMVIDRVDFDRYM